MAKSISEKSKDPSTKTGAVIVDSRQRLVSTGYNGFARKVGDNPERYLDRDMKIEMVVHCEVNAIVFAKRDLEGCTLYTYPFMSCSRCAGVVIQAGIRRCVAPVLPADKADRWKKSMELATLQFQEAGVLVDLLEFK